MRWMISITPRPLYSWQLSMIFGWAPESDWTLENRRKHLFLLQKIRQRYFGFPNLNLVTVPTELSRCFVFSQRHFLGCFISIVNSETEKICKEANWKWITRCSLNVCLRLVHGTEHFRWTSLQDVLNSRAEVFCSNQCCTCIRPWSASFIEWFGAPWSEGTLL